MIGDSSFAGSASGSAFGPAGDELTHVELTWIEQRVERWIRFGDVVRDHVIDRRRRIVSFAPGSVFAFVRWAANDHGTVISRIDIVRAVGRSECCSTLPCVSPGGDILLHISGWPKVIQVLRAIDAVEALGLDPRDVALDHWRHLHNRMSSGQAARSYTVERHRAWLQRKRLLA